ncbi:MAG: glucose-6-phosphate dehydrogenase assembly protein OpcA [Elainellaceae cyanobacterium]
MTTSLVTLQAPKDISLDEIESELNKIWMGQDGDRVTPAATRATTFSMVVYEPEEFQQLLAILGFYDGAIDGIHDVQTKQAIRDAQTAYDLRVTGRIDSKTLERLREEVAKLPNEKLQISNPDKRGFSISEPIAAQNPCRIITLCPIQGEDTGVTAQVSAYCPVHKANGNSLVCCEYITLRGTKDALERVANVVTSLMTPDMPKFVWWKATPNPEQTLFKQLSAVCNCIIVDSSFFSDAESELLKIHQQQQQDTSVADLNWHRLSPWQELMAAAFDPPERRAALVDIDVISIDYEKGNSAQALMFLGWIASRLGWKPVKHEVEGGDYDIKRVYFDGPDGKEVEAELAAIPTADWGEILGDLVGLRVSSSNEQADCCTILCSETTGCMRMEAGGSAQSCRTEQVTALSDQRAEALMSQQLQRWGKDALYDESLDVTAQIVSLANQR